MNVSITMVRALTAAVERAGVPRERLFAAAGLDPRRLEDANAQLPVDEFARVQRAALQLSGDDALGLHLGEQASSPEFELLGHLTAHAATLRQGIQTLARYASIVTAGPLPELCEEGDTALIRHAFSRQSSPSVRFAAELTLSGMLRLIRQFVAPDALPRAVYFAYEAPAYRSEYTRIFGGVERFEHPFTGIEFERAWLDRPQLHENAELYAVLRAQAERALSRLTRDAALVERLKAHLASMALGQMPPMSNLARELGMSERSLRRRLVAEGNSYKSLVEQARVNAAKRMLEDPRASIKETAHALGFTAPGAFHRAFKRWTGMTPKEYKASF